jgi:hypothetical protein
MRLPGLTHDDISAKDYRERSEYLTAYIEAAPGARMIIVVYC